jgi:hypothetical protein
MHGQRVGYIRVSTLDQNPERQLEQVARDRVYPDYASGKDIERPREGNCGRCAPSRRLSVRFFPFRERTP